MTIETDIKTILDADATISALLTGGIYTKQNLGKTGINAQAVPAAYNVVDGYAELLPCVVIKQGGVTPDYQMVDTTEQRVSGRQRVEFWFYDNDGYATLSSARERLYTLLQRKTFNFGVINWVNNVDGQRDQSMDDAALLRADYLVSKLK